MKRFDIPILITLLLVACIHYEHHSTTGSEYFFDGLRFGIAVLAVTAIVLCFRIFNAAHDACLKRGLIAQPLRFRYDVLIPVAVVAVAIKGNWIGHAIIGMDQKPVPEWTFRWSDTTLDAPFVGAVIGVALLLRILALVRAIAGPAIRER